LQSESKSRAEKVRKGVALVSGGADSMLALRLVQKQGIEMLAINFCSCFFGCRKPGVGKPGTGLQKACESFGVPLRNIMLGDEYLRMLADPKHGYGKASNPCVDCHILMLQKAREVMIDEGASFVVTGEILGQRPMSQHMQALRNVERESGLRGRLLRPLSARLLPPTYAELAGIVDRRGLLAFNGRSRKPQLELARKLGIESIPNSGGGCVLTERRFGYKVRDMFRFAGDSFPTMNDAALLRYGRHMRRSPEFKIVVGRSEEDNQAIEALAREGDLMFYPPDETNYVGPVVLVRGKAAKADWPWIASILLRYSDVESGELLPVAIRDHRGNTIGNLESRAIDPGQVPQHMIAHHQTVVDAD